MEEAGQRWHPEKGCGAAQNHFAWTLDWRCLAITAVIEQQIDPENSALERQHGDFILVEERTEEMSILCRVPSNIKL